MKITIYLLLAPFMLGALNADSFSDNRLELISLSLNKRDIVIPEVTLLSKSSLLKQMGIDLSFTRSLIVDYDSLFDRIQPIKTVLYTQINYRF